MQYEMLKQGIDTSDYLAELEAYGQWNIHEERRVKAGPHHQADDIWLRYVHDMSQVTGQYDEFDVEWLDESIPLPLLSQVCMDIFSGLQGTRLGGCLITRLPPGKSILPHRDLGWHPEYYEKYCLQLQGDPKQTFWFGDDPLPTNTGDFFRFENQEAHSVVNDSQVDRISLIVCVSRR